MTTRRRSNKWHVANDTTASSMAVFSPELAPFCIKWALRVLIDLGAHHEIVQNTFCSEPGLMRALGVNETLIDNYEQQDLLLALRNLHCELTSEGGFTQATDIETSEAAEDRLVSRPLVRNIEWLAHQVSLSNDEKIILLFCVLTRQNLFLSQAVCALGLLSTARVLSVLSTILGIPLPRVHQAMSEDSGLIKSGMLNIDENAHFDFNNKIEMLTGLSEQLMLEQHNLFYLFSSNFIVAPAPKLKATDFAHLGQKFEYLSKYLANAVSKQTKGVNILLYGRPGTGKTELGRTLAAQLGLELFEVTVEGPRGSQISGKHRLHAYQLSQRILAKRTNAILVFDEIEDIAPGGDDDFGFAHGNQSGQKGYLNQLLQENAVPTIWITNSLYPLDPAHLRRFDYCLQMEIPPKSVRAAMLMQCTQGLNVSAEWCEEIAANSALSPALMTRAAKVASAMFEAGASPSAELLLDDVIESAVKVQTGENHRVKKKNGGFGYQLDAVNSDCHLPDVIDGLVATGEGRICLYGPPGTGKSAFAKHVAKALGKPALLRRASDILGSLVGQTEHNLAAMFQEAKAENAVLILDEADSFLRDRDGAIRNWEITIVNEMLTQMESFEGIFFATTNLMDHLDSASLRRFDMKINLGFLKYEQRRVLFRNACESLKFDVASSFETRLRDLDHLTPGDFDNVLRQSRLRPLRTAEDLIERLKQETKLKKQASTRSIGFMTNHA
jgi:SpoVK/Ycf46/Vps4 family AAA+-type ATPase